MCRPMKNSPKVLQSCQQLAKDTSVRPGLREVAEYFELLRFPSVGADEKHLKDCIQCAKWLKKWLEGIGAEAELLLPEDGSIANASPPVVFAERAGDRGAPTILFYGHYDVQPPDPVEEWLTPPFAPTEKDGRVYCRGAQDDKGQLFSFLCGLRDFLRDRSRLSDRPIPSFKFILEGQEESSGEVISRVAQELGDKLSSDILLVCDTEMASDMRPTIVAGLRGVGDFTITLKAANYDLHSGRYGGIIPNAAQGMAELLASLHNPDGSIAVKGFCDKVAPPTTEELAAAEESAISDADYLKEHGVAPIGGESGFSSAERGAFRPTIEINGIHSGYGGPGSKTIIPSEAVAKLSMRLVAGQDPVECMELLIEHLRLNTPKGMSLSVSDVSVAAPAMRLPITSPVFKLAAAVLKRIDSRGALFKWDGASIPIVSTLARISGAAPLLVGFGQSEDRIHSPNESFSWRQFELGRRWAYEILSEFI